MSINKNLDFIDNPKDAILVKPTNNLRLIIWVIAIFFILFFIWLYYFKINQFVRVYGKVIPSKKTQVIQNLEGGIVTDVYISEGDYVNIGEPLVKLDDTSATTKLDEVKLQRYSLLAKKQRLEAQINNLPFHFIPLEDEEYNQSMYNEQLLFNQNKLLYEQELKIAQTKLKEKTLELESSKIKLKGLKDIFVFIEDEYSMKKALFEDKVGSKIDFSLVQQKLSDAKQKITTLQSDMKRLKSVIIKHKEEISHIKQKFRQKSVAELNLIETQLKQFEKMIIQREDIVERRLVKSHIKGVINQVLVNTIGQIVKSGEDMVTITPLSDQLIIECKVRPSDIASLSIGQNAVVHFSAYDFAIFGTLDGKVIKISADTIEDKIDKQYYYTAYIRTDKIHLGQEESKLIIMPGMMATIDVVGEPITLLNYLLKPILRAKQNFLSQR